MDLSLAKDVIDGALETGDAQVALEALSFLSGKLPDAGVLKGGELRAGYLGLLTLACGGSSKAFERLLISDVVVVSN